MQKITILWADDEIDLFKPTVLFLTDKGYNVITVTNGNDALDIVQKSHIDVVFLDESMPGLSGLQTLMVGYFGTGQITRGVGRFAPTIER